MKVAVVISFAMMVTACAPHAHESFPGPTGKVSYAVECLDDEKNCRPQAEKLCPQGYAVANARSQVMAIWRGMDVVNRIRFYLTIECNE